jgi:hypothetical protein
LTSKNKIVYNLNNKILDRLEGNEKTYISINSISKADNIEDYDQIVADYPPEFLNKVEISGMSLH